MSVPTTLRGRHGGCGGEVVFRPGVYRRELLAGQRVTLRSTCRTCGASVTLDYELPLGHGEAPAQSGRVVQGSFGGAWQSRHAEPLARAVGDDDAQPHQGPQARQGGGTVAEWHPAGAEAEATEDASITSLADWRARSRRAPAELEMQRPPGEELAPARPDSPRSPGEGEAAYVREFAARFAAAREAVRRVREEMPDVVSGSQDWARPRLSSAHEPRALVAPGMQPENVPYTPVSTSAPQQPAAEPVVVSSPEPVVPAAPEPVVPAAPDPVVVSAPETPVAVEPEPVAAPTAQPAAPLATQPAAPLATPAAVAPVIEVQPESSAYVPVSTAPVQPGNSGDAPAQPPSSPYPALAQWPPQTQDPAAAAVPEATPDEPPPPAPGFSHAMALAAGTTPPAVQAAAGAVAPAQPVSSQLPDVHGGNDGSDPHNGQLQVQPFAVSSVAAAPTSPVSTPAAGTEILEEISAEHGAFAAGNPRGFDWGGADADREAAFEGSSFAEADAPKRRTGTGLYTLLGVLLLVGCVALGWTLFGGGGGEDSVQIDVPTPAEQSTGAAQNGAGTAEGEAPVGQDPAAKGSANPAPVVDPALSDERAGAPKPEPGVTAEANGLASAADTAASDSDRQDPFAQPTE